MSYLLTIAIYDEKHFYSGALPGFLCRKSYETRKEAVSAYKEKVKDHRQELIAFMRKDYNADAKEARIYIDLYEGKGFGFPLIKRTMRKETVAL